MTGPSWIFGYGSLIWRPDITHVARRAGWIEGWSRRFWQGSTDHRGFPGSPGRVVTLVQEEGARCWGALYALGEGGDAMLDRLDVREQGGYDRHSVRAQTAEGGAVEALVYVANARNPNWLGEASASAIAAQVVRSVGPSGPNPEYVLRLAEALTEMGASDDHVEAIAREVRALQEKKRRRADA